MKRIPTYLIWVPIEFITIVGGSFAVMLKLMDRRGTVVEPALGAVMVALGIMIRLWRKEFMQR